jgi:hypothetical protein
VSGCAEEAASAAADSVGDGETVPSDGAIVTRDTGDCCLRDGSGGPHEPPSTVDFSSSTDE